MIKRLFILLLALSAHFSGYSAHLVGGEMAYTCLGNNEYEFNLTIYRDCFSSGAAFDQEAYISIYDINGVLIKDIEAPMNTPVTLPTVPPNSCTSLPVNVCTEKAVYTITATLPPIPGGYTISSQRCCRNATISNIPNPGDVGNTYTIKIPSNDTNCNSSPSFNADPPVALCLGLPVNLDLSATEPDGDSIFYTLCEFYSGGGQNTTDPTSTNYIRPKPASPPPYNAITFNGFLSAQNPITASPPFSLNPITGILTGTPTQIGQFVFGICVEEYRNGIQMSILRRDFQFNISGSCVAVTSAIESQISNANNLCAGKTIDLSENCLNTNSYYWDFGDPASTTDNSTQPNPTYTYTDTGHYTVMLIAEPQSACADTAYEIFHVVEPPQVSFTVTGNICFDVHEMNFTSSGDFTPNAKYQWNFGGALQATVDKTALHPKQVKWVEPGTYLVELSVEDNGCTSTFSIPITLFARPQLKHKAPEVSACLPITVSFQDSSDYFGSVIHYWDFGDSQGSAEASPVHTYTSAGVYDVSHTLITTQGCKDTLRETFPLAIEVWPIPEGNLDVSKEEASIFDPFFTLIDTTLQTHTETFIPGLGYVKDIDEVTFKIQDTGSFNITHITYNTYGCSDTIIQTLKVFAPLSFYIPNAFTPNGDGLNETFDVSILGVNEYLIQIYDRWGKRLFQSTSQDISWNGKLKNVGKEVPIGYYWYLVRVIEAETGIEHREEGTIALMR